MMISGFTIIRNATKFSYPAEESILSILPICDEFIINVGDSDDKTLEMMQSLQRSYPDKIRIIENKWDLSEGKTVLSKQTNMALKECKGDWAFYLQSDEVIHEKDLVHLRKIMHRYLKDENIDTFRFPWLHFYGSYYRYRIDSGWYQKQDRIIRNNGEIESFGDAYGFQCKDGQSLKRKNTNCFLYHYGWVHSEPVMTQRRINAEKIGFTTLQQNEREREYSFGDLNRFPIYFGSHPAVMKERIAAHHLSQRDSAKIHRRYWWHPFKIFKIRYKTPFRLKTRIA